MADTDPYHGIPRDAATFRPTEALRCPLCEMPHLAGGSYGRPAGFDNEERIQTGYEFSCACGFTCWIPVEFAANLGAAGDIVAKMRRWR